MNISHLSRRQTLMLLAACTLAPAHIAHAVPSNSASIYPLNVTLTDQNGEPFKLSDARGQPVLISMFYSSCEAVCPMIFETISMTLRQLSITERRHVRVVMVSFDPARDTVPVLKKTADARGANEQWTLARGTEADVRQVAAVLGVQYRRLASGEFNHSSTVMLLDGEGQIALRSNTLGAVDPKLVQALHRMIAA